MADQIFDSNDRIPDENDCNGGAILWLFVALAIGGLATIVVLAVAVLP